MTIKLHHYLKGLCLGHAYRQEGVAVTIHHVPVEGFLEYGMAFSRQIRGAHRNSVSTKAAFRLSNDPVYPERHKRLGRYGHADKVASWQTLRCEIDHMAM